MNLRFFLPRMSSNQLDSMYEKYLDMKIRSGEMQENRYIISKQERVKCILEENVQNSF